MRLLYYDNGELCLTKDLSNNIPPYAILSHRWGQDEDEVKFGELGSPDKNKAGYRKLRLCGEQASKDGLNHFWVDTCCIDKSSSAELDKNINSMFRYYRESTKCYVYLPDVDSDEDFEQSEWFARGWTLQELLAPQCIEFYSQKWRYLGSKADLQHRIHHITKIPVDALNGKLSQFTKDEKLQWIRTRETTEKEDKAYCLVGIFNVSMSLHYGEGEARAFVRLENKIKKSLKPTLQTVDDSIRDYYLDAGRLNIERLSGQCLPMESCFINLSIVDVLDSKRTNADPTADGLTLTARLKVETPIQSKQVTLERLFDRQNLAHGRTTAPKRVLIWGRAGIGKTTLCKKMVYDFYYNDLWQDLYDRVFWLPLRRLKWLRDEVKSVAEMVEKVCFHSAIDGLFPIEQLQDMLGNRCLFLLDGLDEVSSAFDPDSSIAANLNKLLSQENVIVTSRPHSTDILDRIPPDLRLETIGFYPAQVEEYLQKSADLSQSQVLQIRTFLKGRPILQSLVRIPIQLDAMCYTWSMVKFQQDSTTMTELYQATSNCLWKKDVVRLGMKFEGEAITPQQIQMCSDVRFLIEQEVACLEKLAFTGLYHRVVEFSLTNINSVAKNPHPHLIDRICRSSFLRSSDERTRSIRQSYHFIHLTFQEFFAARCFVRCFSSGETMNLPTMMSMDAQASRIIQVEPIAFIKKEKYNTHFNIFWRLVTGLLLKTEDSHLRKFFNMLESEPIDLLGLSHQRLMVYCLNEVGASQESLDDEARKLICSYTEWTQFESRLCNTHWLLEEAECPIKILEQLLKGSDVEREVLMDSLSNASNVSPSMLGMIIEQADKEGRGAFYDRALTVVAVHCDQLADDHLTKTLPGWDKQEWLEAVGRADRKFHDKGLFFIQNAAFLLQHGNSHCQRLAISALELQLQLPGLIIEQFVRQLEDKDHAVGWQATDLLELQRSLPEPVIIKLGQLLKDQAPVVRQRSIMVLGQQASLTDSIMTSLFELLYDQNPDVQREAAYVLRNHESLPESMVTRLVRSLEDHNPKIRAGATDILRCQKTLPESVIVRLIDLLEDQDAYIRNSAMNALSRQQSLPESVVDRFVQLVEEEDPYVRAPAIYFLGEQRSLPESGIEKFVQLLGDHDPHVRGSAARILGRQKSLRESVSIKIVQLLGNHDRYVRDGAADSLARHHSLPESVGIRIAQLLRDHDHNIRGSAMEALVGQRSLPESVITGLVRLLGEGGHGDYMIRWQAANALVRQLQLSELHCRSIVHLLKHKRLTANAIRVLESHAHLAQLIIRLNSVSLRNVMRVWLAESFSPESRYLLTLHDGNFVVEVNGKKWELAIEDKQQKAFKERWVEVQRVLGVPGVPLKNARVLRKRTRD